ncbi:MAG TPA: DedA family protein [Steroidobacteraceae bacterium]|nr:DedA family protein [Steroidobacteraceae bacterium]
MEMILELIHWFVDVILHLDAHLVELLRDYGVWVYAILFAIVFAETGFVITPFLPGDSLLFAAGALAAVDSSGTLSAPLVSLTLIIAAIGGNTTNYHIGKWIGPPAFTGKIRFLKVEYLKRTEEFFVKHGSMTIVLSRFVPIIRTCAPFVAGVARMPYARFQAYNVFGGLSWVLLLVWAGYFFGNIPIIKENFGIVTIGIIVVSLLPLAWVALRK